MIWRLFLVLFLVVGAGAGELRILAPAGYFSAEVLEGFNAKISLDTFKRPDELYAKMLLRYEAKYDLLIAPATLIPLLKKEALIKEFDSARLKNRTNVFARLQNQHYDLYATHSLAASFKYLVFVGGGEMGHWGDFWGRFGGSSGVANSGADSRVGGGQNYRLILPNDPVALMEASLLKEGIGADFAAALKRVLGLKIAQIYDDFDGLKEAFDADSNEVGLVWASEAARLKGLGANLQITAPKEGSIAFLDAYLIPHNAANLGLAYRFIDYMLTPKNALKNALFNGSIPAIKLDLLKAADPGILNILAYPDDATLNSLATPKELSTTIFESAKSWQIIDDFLRTIGPPTTKSAK